MRERDAVKKLLIVAGLLAGVIGLLFGADAALTRYRDHAVRLDDWQSRCDQYRGVTPQDDPALVKAWQACRDEAQRLADER